MEGTALVLRAFRVALKDDFEGVMAQPEAVDSWSSERYICAAR
jgi:hypothetical protein